LPKVCQSPLRSSFINAKISLQAKCEGPGAQLSKACQGNATEQVLIYTPTLP